MSTTKLIGQWKIRRVTPKSKKNHEGHSVIEILHLSLYRRESGKEKILAKLAPIALVQTGKKSKPNVLPIDRAKAWEELIGWIKHLAIFPDEAVKEGQHQNRLKWESWAHAATEKPKAEDLYDWQRDEAALKRLRPRYLHLALRLTELIGHPKKTDLDLLYPNKYDDEGLSDQARAALRDLKTLFGAEIVK